MRRSCLSGVRRGFTLIELAVVLVIIGILTALVLPNYVRLKDKAKEAETKANLHNIQLALERSAVDTDGNYPAYLIGGDNEYMNVDIGSDGSILANSIEIDPGQCTDPMLRQGYLSTYPRNPFVRDGRAVHSLQRSAGDPLRSSLSDGQQMGTRFGANGNIMGQVLCEARWLTWDRTDPATHELKTWPTWANVQFGFYDVWPGNRSRPYLPGSFAYKSMGEILPSKDASRTSNKFTINTNSMSALADRNHDTNDTVYPIGLTDYVLTAWGGIRTKGMDILGEEPLVLFRMRNAKRSVTGGGGIFRPSNGGLGPYVPPPPPPEGEATPTTEIRGLPSWTRGVNRSHIGPLWGAPFGPASDDSEQLSHGNPNGIRDGLIILLTPGSD